MTVWFTSDLHLNHRAVAWQRLIGWWPNPDERRVITPELCRKHDDHLARRWDERVQPDDQIWVLGDLVANAKDLPYALGWMQERPGRKHMVFGNHDAGHPMHAEAHTWEDRYRDAFESVGPIRTRKVTIPNWSTHRVVMSHFPYEGDRAFADDRYQPYRLRDGGMPLIHGHVHTRARGTLTEAGTPQIHVGVDAWDLTPVRLEQVVDLLARHYNGDDL